MAWKSGRRGTSTAASFVVRSGALFAAACALALAGCNQDGAANVAAAQPRGATVAFESIDGPPTGQFQKLLRDLSDEAQARRLAVISREQPSAYRVRGYLAAKVAQGETTISWVWDVFDKDEQRALRVTGEETAKARHNDAWNAADDAMLQRIAQSSMDQIAAFLTSPDVAPGTPDAVPQLALMGTQDSTPEAAGIFKISNPTPDPVSGSGTESTPAATDDGTAPLPPRKPNRSAELSTSETLTLSGHSVVRP
jgi:hypothetical protein